LAFLFAFPFPFALVLSLHPFPFADRPFTFKVHPFAVHSFPFAFPFALMLALRPFSFADRPFTFEVSPFEVHTFPVPITVAKHVVAHAQLVQLALLLALVAVARDRDIGNSRGIAAIQQSIVVLLVQLHVRKAGLVLARHTEQLDTFNLRNVQLRICETHHARYTSQAHVAPT
jgi:hypothetical protein